MICHAERTLCRTGLQATAEIYLKNVTLDEGGFVVDYQIAFLDWDGDPHEIKRATSNAINLDQPERVRVYDGEDRYLAGHPGTPREHSCNRYLAWATGVVRRVLSLIEGPPRPVRALVVINSGGVPERVCGNVTIIDFSDLAQDSVPPATLKRLADEVQRDFGTRAQLTMEDLRELVS